MNNVGNAWYKLFFYDDLDIDPGPGSTVLAADFNGDALAKYTPDGNYAARCSISRRHPALAKSILGHLYRCW